LTVILIICYVACGCEYRFRVAVGQSDSVNPGRTLTMESGICLLSIYNQQALSGVASSSGSAAFLINHKTSDSLIVSIALQ
jgi:hypothetical protein